MEKCEFQWILDFDRLSTLAYSYKAQFNVHGGFSKSLHGKSDA